MSGDINPNDKLEEFLAQSSLFVDKVEDASTNGLTEYVEAMVKGDYAKAQSDLELVLTESPADSKARLLWVECQLQTGSIPVTALTTPLEELYEHVQDKDVLQVQSVQTYLRAGDKLLKRNQTRLAVLILQRAYELSKVAISIEEDVQSGIASFYVSVLRAEIDKAELRRESKIYVAGLRAKLKELEKVVVIKPKAASSDKAQRSRRYFNSKSILQDVTKPSAVEDESETDSLDQSTSSLVKEDVKKDRSGSFGSKVITILCMFAAVVSVVVGSIFLMHDMYPKLGDEELDSRLASVQYGLSEPELVIPEVVPKTADSAKISTIDFAAVKNRLANLNKDGANSQNSKKEIQQPPSTEIVSKPKPQAVTPDPGRSSVISDQIQRDLERERKRAEAVREREYKENSPNINPERVQGLDVHSVGGNDRRTGSGLRITGDGRVFGAPKDSPQVGSVGISPYDGSPVYAQEVREFKDGTFFRIITATEVYSSPSLLAVSMARLEANAKVQVVAQIGHWLELQSTGGRRGYIYAQDAVKIN